MQVGDLVRHKVYEVIYIIVEQSQWRFRVERIDGYGVSVWYSKIDVDPLEVV